MAARPRQRAGALIEERLDAAVFERVERHHGQTAARAQHPFAGGEAEVELAELIAERMPAVEKVRLVSSGTEAGSSPEATRSMMASSMDKQPSARCCCM